MTTVYYVVLTKTCHYIPMVTKQGQQALVDSYYKLGDTDIDTFEEEIDSDCPF